MNTGIGLPQIGQWYLHMDKGEIFQVTGLDDQSGTIEIQTFGGDVDEIDEDSWKSMPLGLAEQPEDWTGPVDSVNIDDLGYSDTEMTAPDSDAPLDRLSAARKPWEEPGDLGNADEEEEIVPPELTRVQKTTPSQKATRKSTRLS